MPGIRRHTNELKLQQETFEEIRIVILNEMKNLLFIRCEMFLPHSVRDQHDNWWYDSEISNRDL